MSDTEVRALMTVINEMRRTGNPLLEQWADRIQNAVEDAAEEASED